MKVILAISAIVALTGCAASGPPLPPTAQLQGVVGQTCVYRGNQDETHYTIRHQDGKWAVHDVFGSPGTPLRDAGWHPATVNGSSISFPGVTVGQITLTATGPHTIETHVDQGIHSYSFAMACS
ncbi:MAG: hypothetical protein ACREFY_09065 [Acetobacteraceae bacterium]